MAGQRAPLLLIACLSSAMLVMRTAGASAVPAIFIFGDSTADVGNNNFLTTQLKADFPHYGIDFVGARPTGRFSNGYNSADFIARTMGFRRSPPPFLSLTENMVRRQAVARGINFASAGSGILETTGSSYGEFISMGLQLQHFATIRMNLTVRIGLTATESLLAESIFLISTGSNDMLDDYIARGPLNRTQKGYFISALAYTYKSQLMTLYNLGARKLGVVSVPPIGCCPSPRSLNASGGCIDDLNESAQMFYWATKAVLAELSSELKDMKYALGNVYEMLVNLFENPIPSGFKELKSACCGVGKFNGELPCLPFASYCSDRESYLFWDWFHPTQAASKLAAQTLYSGPKRFVSPINFKQLAEDDF